MAQAPAVPWLLSGNLVATRDTLRTVYDAFDADTKVVPGHGPVTDIAAITDGLNLEDTVAQVQLSSFQGYALFGWVHPNMNVPAAYSELK